MDEHEALSALRRRDERALEWFIDRYAAYVGTVAANILASALSVADAEEVSADVFYTLWVNAKRIRPGKVKPYLAGVARNKAKERLRRCGAELPLEDDVLLLSAENPERRLEAREQARFIRQAVLAMPQPEHEIFFRYYYYCQPVARIAQEMALNPATVKTRPHRGRQKLKETLTKGGYPIET